MSRIQDPFPFPHVDGFMVIPNFAHGIIIIQVETPSETPLFATFLQTIGKKKRFKTPCSLNPFYFSPLRSGGRLKLAKSSTQHKKRSNYPVLNNSGKWITSIKMCCNTDSCACRFVYSVRRQDMHLGVNSFPHPHSLPTRLYPSPPAQ